MYFTPIFLLMYIIVIRGKEVFTIYTNGCVIPDFPKVSESIRTIVNSPNRKKCAETLSLLESNSTHINVLKENFDAFLVYGDAQFYCCYQNFSAIDNLENIQYGECISFTSSIKAEHEFVRVECYYMDDKIFEDFFAFGIPKRVPDTEFNTSKFNILILGIESMSRLNFPRTMPKTAKFLKDRGSIQLHGYNKVGDNSFPNLFPVLMGLSFENVRKNCIFKDVIDTDQCVLVWDMFKNRGYATALGSDSVSGLLGIYEYKLQKLPTDFYLQPFMLEVSNIFKNKDYGYHMCYRNKYFYKTLLNYISSLTRNLKHGNLFSFFWEESVSHEHLCDPLIMDDDYMNFLIDLEENEYLNSTILIFLSDHGMRWGPIVRTQQGRLEERLPLLEVLFPNNFRQRYSRAYQNFKANSHRLTTPYDIHATLLNLMDSEFLENRNIQEKSNFGLDLSYRSLFLTIPENRTCESVGIHDHWCSCYRGEKVPIKGGEKFKAANYLVNQINYLLRDFPQCSQLKLNKIIYATVVKDKYNNGNMYTVVIETSPGHGIFDSTLLTEKNVWAVSGTVSRLNLYRDQSRCISDITVKMYCYCV